jgi:hypothetical protein
VEYGVDIFKEDIKDSVRNKTIRIRNRRTRSRDGRGRRRNREGK